MESHGAVGRLVGQSVSRNQSVRKEERVYSSRLVMCKIDVRRKEAEGFYKYKKNAKTLGVVQSTPP